MRQKLQINWNLPENDTKLRRFRRYLRDNGVRPALWRTTFSEYRSTLNIGSCMSIIDWIYIS